MMLKTMRTYGYRLYMFLLGKMHLLAYLVHFSSEKKTSKRAGMVRGQWDVQGSSTDILPHS